MQLATHGIESAGHVFRGLQSDIQTGVGSILLPGCDQFSCKVSEEQWDMSLQLH